MVEKKKNKKDINLKRKREMNEIGNMVVKVFRWIVSFRGGQNPHNLSYPAPLGFPHKKADLG